VLTGSVETCPHNTNHAVLLVGYGEMDGTLFWKIKNSWGSSWGMDGYILIERSNTNLCGVTKSGSYPVLPGKPGDATSIPTTAPTIPPEIAQPPLAGFFTTTGAMVLNGATASNGAANAGQIRLTGATIVVIPAGGGAPKSLPAQTCMGTNNDDLVWWYISAVDPDTPATAGSSNSGNFVAPTPKGTTYIATMIATTANAVPQYAIINYNGLTLSIPGVYYECETITYLPNLGTMKAAWFSAPSDGIAPGIAVRDIGYYASTPSPTAPPTVKPSCGKNKKGSTCEVCAPGLDAMGAACTVCTRNSKDAQMKKCTKIGGGKAPTKKPPAKKPPAKKPPAKKGPSIRRIETKDIANGPVPRSSSLFEILAEFFSFK